MTNRLFSKPRPKELLTNKESSAAWGQIQKHRQIKNDTLPQPSRWPSRIHGLLTSGLFISFFSILFGIYLALFHCSGSDSTTSEGCFEAAVWACGVFSVLLVAKCYWNSKYPLP